VQLVVQGDDFGMCHAVNAGVVTALTDGILTQASAMAPCPWVDEALRLAAVHDIPLGLHQTLTCDWENFRWRPLTRGRSLVGPDGYFRDTVAEAAAAINAADAEAELLAQAARISGSGLSLGYLDVHMGLVCEAAYERVSQELGAPFLYPGLPTSLRFTSIRSLSQRKASEKLPWLLAWLEGLAPGVHLLVTHPGVGGAELASLTSASSPVYAWAEEYRVSDLAVLTDGAVRRAVKEHGIRLTSVASADFSEVT